MTHIAKKSVQRNMPLGVKYEIKDSFYISVEDGGCTCDNCGKLISNVVVLIDENKAVFNVGTDCAPTLLKACDMLKLSQIDSYFSAGKSARAAIQKYIKKAKASGVTLEITYKIFEDDKNFYKQVGTGGYRIESLPFNIDFRSWKFYPPHMWAYVYPMIKNLTTK